MAAVVMAFRAALVAEPALRRVEPVSTSGPVRMATTTSASVRRPGRGAQVTRIVGTPRARALSRPPRARWATYPAARCAGCGSRWEVRPRARTRRSAWRSASARAASSLDALHDPAPHGLHLADHGGFVHGEHLPVPHDDATLDDHVA